MPEKLEKTARGSLEYDRADGGHISSRRYRLLLALTLLNTLMLAGLVGAPYVVPFAREKWQQWQAARAAERERVRIVAYEQQCLAYAAPADRVVYEEDPDAAAKLLALPGGAYEPVIGGVNLALESAARRFGGGGYGGGGSFASVVPPGYQSPARAALPQHVREFLGLADAGMLFGNGGGGGGGGGVEVTEPALLFMHERTTPGGERLLVEVWLRPGLQIGGTGVHDDAGTSWSYRARKRRQLIARAWSVPPAPAQPQLAHEWVTLLALPDAELADVARVAAGGAGRSSADVGDESRTRGATTQPVKINYGNRLKFFAGQADPADPSHFTIAYQVDGQAGTIDGHVRDNELVLRPRAGAPAGNEVVQQLLGIFPAPPTLEVWDLAAPPAPAAEKPPAEAGRSD